MIPIAMGREEIPMYTGGSEKLIRFLINNVKHVISSVVTFSRSMGQWVKGYPENIRIKMKFLNK